MTRVNLLALAFAILGALPAVVRGQEAFSLPEVRVGAAYEFSIPAEGGLPPLHWKIAAGELPPGIELGSSGTLRGIATVRRPDAYQFTTGVGDSSQPPHTFAQRFTLRVKRDQLHTVLGG